MDMSQIDQALSLLRAGKLVGLPTETVYGLGANARNEQAVERIFLAKQRPFTHPLIVHLASFEQLSAWAQKIPASAALLAQAFWPGPLTLILKKRPEVLSILTGGQDTIGLRIPAHPVALALLKAFGDGIAAPSANRYTHLSPTSAEAVREELGAKVDLVLEGGDCEVGIESTIVDLSREQPVILRPGQITAAEIEKILKVPVLSSQDKAPRVAGMDKVHYAPDTEVVLVSTQELGAYLAELSGEDLPVACLTRQELTKLNSKIEIIIMSPQPQAYAHDLYCTLRALDKHGLKKIIIEQVPENREWDGIRDRLGKAAAR